jgi:hypothetical protein
MKYFVLIKPKDGQTAFLTPAHEAAQKVRETRLRTWMHEDEEGHVYFECRSSAEQAASVIRNALPDLTVEVDVGDKLRRREMIVRVLSYHGYTKHASDDIRPHLEKIAKRYEELKGELSFSDADLQAKLEWLGVF